MHAKHIKQTAGGFNVNMFC